MPPPRATTHSPLPRLPRSPRSRPPQAVLKHLVTENPFELRVPEFSVAPGELVAVVGRVGAGKSSLLQALLGNMTLTSGACQSGGKISYVPQTAWCQNLTLKVCAACAGLPPAASALQQPAAQAACRAPLTPRRPPGDPPPQENIVFGQPYDDAHYRAVLHACALELDLQILPAGDQSKVSAPQARAAAPAAGPACARLVWRPAAPPPRASPRLTLHPPRPPSPPHPGRPARHQPVWRPAPAPQPRPLRLLRR